MRMCDEAAGIAAIRHCGKRVVAGGMDRMTFTERDEIIAGRDGGPGASA